jgi:ABC-type branched-subunit amino acid transport system substrate-binding protein
MIILASVAVADLQAQKVEYDSKFKAGVNDYKQGKYALAMEKLAPLTSVSATYSYSEYAHYYYALAAYQNKKYKESRQMLLQLLSRFPSWNKLNEVYYLLGVNSLATNQWKDGIQYFQKVKDSSFAKDIQSEKQHYLGGISDLATLINIQKQNPEDRDVAVEVVQFIEKSPGSTQTDLFYSDQLVKQFKMSSKEIEAAGLDRPKHEVSKKDNQWAKGYFNVAVLLPFRLDEFAVSKKRSNQFAYDYYVGLQLAKAKLKTEGIEININAFDVGNDTKTMDAIADDKLFQQSDFVIGPLYQSSFDVAVSYTADANMYMLNPLSTDVTLLKKGENVYLAHPSISFQTQKAAQWMKTVAPVGGAVIYYGTTAKDSSMAFAYQAELKAKGLKILEMMKIHSDREWLESKVSSFETVKPGHFALFSSESGAGPTIMDVLAGRKLTNVPVIATSTSFNLQQSRLNRYGSRLYLIETDRVDREREQIRQFQKAYWNQTNSFPSVYSYQGYDHLLFFGRMLFKYKDKLKNGLEMRKYDEEDYLLSGFDYTKSRENQVPPILKFNGSAWEPAR